MKKICQNRAAGSSSTGTTLTSTSTTSSLSVGYRYHFEWYRYHFSFVPKMSSGTGTTLSGTGTTLSGIGTTSLLYQNTPWVPVPIRGTGTDAHVLPKNDSFHHFSPTKINISSSKLIDLTSHHGIQLKQLQKWVGSRRNPFSQVRAFSLNRKSQKYEVRI